MSIESYSDARHHFETCSKYVARLMDSGMKLLILGAMAAIIRGQGATTKRHPAKSFLDVPYDLESRGGTSNGTSSRAEETES